MKTIILDFDGTIGDTRSLIVRTMQQVISELHLEPRSDEQCAAMIGLPLRQTFADLIPMSEEMSRRCEDTYRRHFTENNKPGMVPLFPHVKETIQTLHRQGYVLTIASSRSRDSLIGYVKDMQLEAEISLILSADDIKHAKPHPEPVLKTLAVLGAEAADAWVVGDTTFDIGMGRAAGCRTCGVTYGNHSRRQLEQAGADAIIDDFAELLNWV